MAPRCSFCVQLLAEGHRHCRRCHRSFVCSEQRLFEAHEASCGVRFPSAEEVEAAAPGLAFMKQQLLALEAILPWSKVRWF
jgi:hypothetical protein